VDSKSANDSLKITTNFIFVFITSFLSCLGSEIETGSLGSKYYLVGLQVSQGKKKSQGRAQNIYTHSSLLKKPAFDQHQIPFTTSGTGSSASDSPTTPDGSPQTHTKDSGKICVASFPSLLSHDDIMDKELLTRKYLTVSFTLTHYQQPT